MEKENGKVRIQLEKIKVKNNEVGAAILDGLRRAGYDVDILPGRMAQIAPGCAPESTGDTITVYMRG